MASNRTEDPQPHVLLVGPTPDVADRIFSDPRWVAHRDSPPTGHLASLALGWDREALARFAMSVPDVPVAYCSDDIDLPEPLVFASHHLPASTGPAEVALCLDLGPGGTGSRLLDRIAVDTSRLPPMPSDLTNLLHVLDRPSATTGDVVRAMRRDPALVAKTLQLANSSYFRLPRRVSSIERAITILGVNAIRVAAMAGRCFDALPGVPTNELSIVRDRGLLAVQLMRSLTGREHPSISTAALLMDIGQLLLLRADRGYPKLRFEAMLRKQPIAVAEIEAYGASHAHYGAALLASWDLPHEVVDAIAFSHTPLPLPHQRNDMRCALFVASAIVEETELGHVGSRLDARWVDSMDLTEAVRDARELASTLATQSPAA